MKSQNSDYTTKITYLAVGLGVGALLGILLAPQSGDDTREWIVTKYKDGIDAVHAKAKQARGQVADLLQQGQEGVQEVVEAGREVFKKVKAVAS